MPLGELVDLLIVPFSIAPMEVVDLYIRIVFPVSSHQVSLYWLPFLFFIQTKISLFILLLLFTTPELNTAVQCSLSPLCSSFFPLVFTGAKEKRQPFFFLQTKYATFLKWDVIYATAFFLRVSLETRILKHAISSAHPTPNRWGTGNHPAQ